MSTYGWILIGTILFPLLLSFEHRIAYHRRWLPVVLSVLVVALPFLAWDVVASLRGDWAFSPAHVAGPGWMGLPLEEYLFFGAAPFSCLFVHAVVQRYLPPKEWRMKLWPWYGAAGLVVLFAVLAWPRAYTSVVCLFLGAFLLLAPILWKPTVATPAFWWAQLLSLAPFLVVDGILTGLPVVTYRDSSIGGVRIFTIPLEDVVYSFVLVGSNIGVSEGLRRWMNGKRSPTGER